MRTLARITSALADKALGTVDAGACIAERGCCCNAAHTYGLDCYGRCVRSSCTVKYSAYGQPC